MRLKISSVLASYTLGQREFRYPGTTIIEGIDALNADFPGIKFRFIDEHGRIRQHMSIFKNGVRVEAPHEGVRPEDQIFITHALSGG